MAEASSDAFIALFTIKGEELLLSPNRTSSVSSGSMLIQPLSAPLAVRSRSSNASMFFISDWGRIGASSHSTGLIPYDRDYARLFLAAANGALSSASAPNTVAFTHVVRALEMLFAALIVSSQPVADSSSLNSDLFAQAMHLIDQLALDPGFTINTLCYRMRVSRSTLYRAFEREGTSPALELRRVRAAAARALLSPDALGSGKQLREFAFSAGFGSVSAMNRALIQSAEFPVGRRTADTAGVTLPAGLPQLAPAPQSPVEI